MSFFSKALKSGLVLKAFEIVKREAAKPENQRKARELLMKAKNRNTRRRI